MDLPTKAFLQLRTRFFDAAGQSIPFKLRPKRNTQDDPFDEFLTTNVLPKIGSVTCSKAPGPLVSPDMVLHTGAARKMDATKYRQSPEEIVGIEVKKLERDERGNIARSSGLDYNTTPPCGTVCVYDSADKQVWIRCFYLFVCIENLRKGAWRMSALVLCDGNALNSDESLYRAIAVDARSKEIGLGSYGDGANRVRPMMIFGNPLGMPHMDRAATIVHASTSLGNDFRMVAVLNRSIVGGGKATFHCFRHGQDYPIPGEPLVLDNPFPTPERDTATRGRGKFTLPFAT